MASDRMMQAIRALERAVDRFEQDMNGLLAPSSSAPSGPSSSVDAAAARAALQSLDSLITELKGQQGG